MQEHCKTHNGKKATKTKLGVARGLTFYQKPNYMMNMWKYFLKIKSITIKSYPIFICL